jgi:hypothetical protein
MSIKAPNMPPAKSERLENRIRSHKAEVARLREELGDPQAALFRFITQRFEVQALVPDDRPKQGVRGSAWEDDDDLNGW